MKTNRSVQKDRVSIKSRAIAAAQTIFQRIPLLDPDNGRAKVGPSENLHFSNPTQRPDAILVLHRIGTVASELYLRQYLREQARDAVQTPRTIFLRMFVGPSMFRSRPLFVFVLLIWLCPILWCIWSIPWSESGASEYLSTQIIFQTVLALLFSTLCTLSLYAFKAWRSGFKDCTVFEELWQARATALVDDICHHLNSRSRKLRLGAARALEGLLPLCSEAEILSLRGTQAQALCKAICREEFIVTAPAFREAALSTLATCGDAHDLKQIDRWLISKTPSLIDAEIESIACLRSRIEFDYAKSTLLRPAKERDEHQLLRPLNLKTEDQAMLLRPASKENPT